MNNSLLFCWMVHMPTHWFCILGDLIVLLVWYSHDWSPSWNIAQLVVMDFYSISGHFEMLVVLRQSVDQLSGILVLVTPYLALI